MTSPPLAKLDLESAAHAVARALPSLPKEVKYYDDFEDKTLSIPNFSSLFDIIFKIDGRYEKFNLAIFSSSTDIVKHIIVDWLHRVDLHTAIMRLRVLSNFVRRNGIESIQFITIGSPDEVRSYWNQFVSPRCSPVVAYALKAFIHSLCNLQIGQWSPIYASMVRRMASPRQDLQRVARSGDCFVPLDQQAAIVDYIDETCARLAQDAATIDNSELRDVCMLITAYQYAFRPGQIARIELADVRVFDTGAVHIAVIASKQQDNRKRARVTRRIKREWSPLFADLLKRRQRGDFLIDPQAPARLLFGLMPADVGTAITELTIALTGEDWTPTDLRHSAAQRLADAGVAHIALSEFMVHASIRTANVYFDTSPTQAQRVNQALAISTIYANVAEIARTRTIDKATLLRLPADQQIGGVPHGIPIAGIGGCQAGQSVCTKNPVLSCYSCRRFMPLGELEIHERVLQQLRQVVLEFASSSRNNEQSPAFVQLRSTLDGVRRIVEDLKNGDGRP